MRSQPVKFKDEKNTLNETARHLSVLWRHSWRHSFTKNEWKSGPSSFCSSVWFGLRHWYVIVLSLSGQWTATKSADQIFNFFDFGSCPLTFYIGRAPCVLILDVPLLPLVLTLFFYLLWSWPLIIFGLSLWSWPWCFLLWTWPFICGPLTLYFFCILPAC